jgi:uncharacterized 2Fe-2S/4Fe-4S cluster protein (DUF4445 family)
MNKLSIMKHNKSRSVCEHIMEMRDIAAQLKSLEIEISESFVVHFILNSLLAKYGDKVKDYLKAIEEQFVSSNKALANTLMNKLSIMKHNKSRGVCEHIMEMRDIAAQLKSLETEISESFVVHFILNSLLAEYGPFKISYNTHKEKWSIN